MNMSANRLLGLSLVLAASSAAADPLTSDRPDFVEATAVLDAGVVQVETGGRLTWADRADAAPDGLDMPSLLKVGVGGEVELRLESALFEWPLGGSARAAALSPGLKWSPWASPDGVAVAVLAHADVPLDGSARSRMEPSLRVVVAGPWNDVWAWGVMPGARWTVDGRGVRRWSGLLGAVVSRALPGGWGTYAEIAAAGFDERGLDAHAGAGATWLLTDDWQLDASVTAGLTDRATPATLGLGVSHRF